MLSYLACKNHSSLPLISNKNDLNRELLVPKESNGTSFCIGWAEKGLSGVVLM